MQALAKELEQSQQRNELLERDLVAQKADHASLVEDMVRICEEKQQLFEECEAGKLEKELAEWIQQQYREKEAELKAAAEGKDEDLRQLQGRLDSVNVDLAELTNHTSYYEKSLAVGDEVIADLRTRLEATEQELDRQANSNSFLQRERNEATQRYILLKSHFGALQEKIAALDGSAELTGGARERQGSNRRRRNRRRGARGA